MMQAYGEGFEILEASDYADSFNYTDIAHLWNQESVVRSWLLELAEAAFRKDNKLYEKVLLDCMSRDQMLFWRQDGIEHCWSFLTPILNECETCDNRSKMLQFYESGSWGPPAIRRI